MTYIITGGAGYIGSHVVLSLIAAGQDVVIVDNFANSSPIAVKRLEEITQASIPLIQADLAKKTGTQKVVDFLQGRDDIKGAVHLAGLKAVGDSVSNPMGYYDINLNSALNLVKILKGFNARDLVFSSSATVYGDLNPSPVDESGKTGPINPYGRCKHFIEMMLEDLAMADPSWRIVNLRYFNPVGAHQSGMIGEDPNGPPNNLFPYIAQTAIGKRDQLSIWGNDYETVDGTGVRDYIHVMDLAAGHVKALEWAAQQETGGCEIFNLGTGRGYSVLEAVAAFEKASGRDVPYQFCARRMGDIAELCADATKANKILGWQAQYDMDDMCQDHWRWQSQNPNGFEA